MQRREFEWDAEERGKTRIKKGGDMLLGVDVSHWQGEMDWYKCRTAGAKFAFIRAGSITRDGGVCYVDDQFERNATLAPDYFPVSFFWYFRPQWDSALQANYFADLVSSKRARLPLVVDVESDGGLSPESVAGSVVNFIHRLYVRLDTWPMIYTRSSFWNDNVGFDPMWEYLDLFIARYIDLPGPWADGLYKPRDWANWVFWQFSADGNGRGGEFGAQSGSIDLDYFNGDEASFSIYAGQAPPEMVKVVWPWAGLRATPEGVKIGYTWRERSFRVLGQSEEWYRVEAWLSKKGVKAIGD